MKKPNTGLSVVFPKGQGHRRGSPISHRNYQRTPKRITPTHDAPAFLEFSQCYMSLYCKLQVPQWITVTMSHPPIYKRWMELILELPARLTAGMPGKIQDRGNKGWGMKKSKKLLEREKGMERGTPVTRQDNEACLSLSACLLTGTAHISGHPLRSNGLGGPVSESLMQIT